LSDARLERHVLLGDRLAVDLQAEAERLRLGGVVHQRDERLVVECPVVVLANRQAGDGDVLAPAPDADPPYAGIGDVRALGQRVGAVCEDVDLGPGLRRDERARRAHRLLNPRREITRLGGADGGERPFAIARQSRRHLRLHARLDHHDLGALAETAHERRGSRARHFEARGGDVARLHRRRRVQDDDDLAGALAHDRGNGPGQRERQRQKREELQEHQRIAMEPLEEGGGFTVAHRGVPQEQARHRPLAPAHLEEVEQDQRNRQREEGQRDGCQEAHATTRPRSWASTNSSIGTSEAIRW
jgi:hypothetical protein